jgi:hypothetical protein
MLLDKQEPRPEDRIQAAVTLMAIDGQPHLEPGLLERDPSRAEDVETPGTSASLEGLQLPPPVINSADEGALTKHLLESAAPEHAANSRPPCVLILNDNPLWTPDTSKRLMRRTRPISRSSFSSGISCSGGQFVTFA